MLHIYMYMVTANGWTVQVCVCVCVHKPTSSSFLLIGMFIY